MSPRRMITVDANEAAASVAYRTNEVIAIYPITPSSTMGELADEWAAHGMPNVWGVVPRVAEMQSEAGAAGAVHGALQAGSLATTFTASQGLLLMIPNMYKIAGELTPFCMHVAARTLATPALSIFGDHSDVMACRQTGFAMIASACAQEAQDLACIGQAATLRSRVPFLHFFDGFRTSHEVTKLEELTDADLLAMLDEGAIGEHRRRALTPDRPVVRGTAQNPDVFFQAREACNPFYDSLAAVIRETMDRFAAITGRRYRPFEYAGHPAPDRVIVLMGSGTQTAHETVDWLVARGEKVGVLEVRVYRPFSLADFAEALPATVRAIAVLDRTKEPGAVGEPLFQDVVSALHLIRQAGRSRQRQHPIVVGGRYGLSSKEFTPGMVRAVFDELAKPVPKHGFTVGIVDDVSGTSLPFDPELDIEPGDTVRAVFFGLGADGTVSANKNSIKILGEDGDRWVQGYFVYDSKKSGAITISHLRFGPRPIRSPYLIRRAGFVACHQFGFLDRYDVLSYAAPGATLLLNAPHDPEALWDRLSQEVQEQILQRKLRVWTINAERVARDAGMGGRINTIMQTCFFAVSGVLPREQAIAAIREAIRKTYGKKGEEVVRRNLDAVDRTIDHLRQVPVPARVTATYRMPPTVSPAAPDFVRRVTALMLAGQGDLLPVSAFPVDGTWPTGTARWEKYNLAAEIPVWDAPLCIQCNKCVLVCPHAAIRAKAYPAEALAGAPATFLAMAGKLELEGLRYTIQVAPEDCTGCGICVQVCPAKDKANPRHKAIDMAPQPPLREPERANYEFFLALPEIDRTKVTLDVRGSQLLEPLFEYSGACSGCGETPYVKLLTQLFGDRALIANATGCSSIYGGNLPTTPYACNREGRGPAWANSLFEDNAEFGLGFRLSLDQLRQRALFLLARLASSLGGQLVHDLVESRQGDETELQAQRARVAELRRNLAGRAEPEARLLEGLADYLVRKSVWIVGGDGWAYDIGYGGLDHVLAMGRDVNLLVLDTEVYSNTGGQQSKATPMGAAAKFAVAGKDSPKKDLGLLAITYGNVYVARVAFGARDAQTVKAFLEAESYPGTSLIIAYSHCIAHGYDMVHGLEQQKLAVDCGTWPLFRFDPRRTQPGESPLRLDSPAPKVELGKYMRNEGRFRMVEQNDPERFRVILEAAQREVHSRSRVYEQIAGWKVPPAGDGASGKAT